MMHDNKITFIQYKNASKLHNNALMPDSKPVDYHFFRAYVNQLKNGIRNDNC
jgi:hypothetical protein